MSRLTPIIEALVAAGATPDMILAAVRAHEEGSAAEIESRRRGDAERQARRRERRKGDVTESHVTSRDVTVTERDTPLPLPSSPQTPQQPTPTPEKPPRPRKGPLAKPEIDVTEQVWQAASKPSRDRSGRPALGKAVLAAIRAGATTEALVASVRDHCRAQGEFAKGADRIVSGEHWRDHAAANDAKATDGPVDPAVQARRARRFRDTGVWEPGWGPKPTQPDQPRHGEAA